MKHKEGFAKCSICSDYERAISGALTLAQREQWDITYFNHVAETKRERAQYYKSRIKGSESFKVDPQQGTVQLLATAMILSIIIDAMDQKKKFHISQDLISPLAMIMVCKQNYLVLWCMDLELFCFGQPAK